MVVLLLVFGARYEVLLAAGIEGGGGKVPVSVREVSPPSQYFSQNRDRLAIGEQKAVVFS